MSEVEDHRAALAACRRIAEKTSDDLEKNTWLDMAETWKLLIICHSYSTGEDIEDINAAQVIDLDAKFRHYLRAYQGVREVVRWGASRIGTLLKSY